MAAPAIRIEGVTLTALLTITDEGVGRLVDHGILTSRETIMAGSVILAIPGQAPIEGTYTGEINGWVKLGHSPPGPFLEAESMYSGKVELSFTGGTFVGIRHFKAIGYPPPVTSYMESHMVLQGTGVFKGQTLKVSFEGDPPLPGPITFEGYLITPK